jgi:succinate-semialdehyde dehydrogenase/glutarate-semialdehyde dehydrogenase
MDNLVVGNPMDETTQIQPLSSKKALEEVSGQVDRAVESGAKIIAGGKKVGEK